MATEPSAKPTLLDQLVEPLADLLKPIVARVTALEKQNEELTKELGALKAAPLLKDAGVWKSDRAYRAGEAVSHHGALWICQRATTDGEPSKDFASWRLAVKKG
jgi:hypothetical protein